MVDQIRNTTEDLRDPANAAMFLLNQLASDDPGDPTNAIERMEADGQRQLVNSDRLPTKVNSDGGDEAFVALGFTFGEPDPGDKLFRPATLPPGWSRQATDHSMWSKLVDEHGRERVSIFYKAAFYDRDAFMSLGTRYGYLWALLYDGARPVLDDEWLPAATACEELEKIALAAEREASESDDFAAQSGGNDEYWTKRATEHRARAAKARALAESLVAS